LKKIIIIFLMIFLYANKKVNIQLNGKYQFEFAGFIIAKEKGFYKQEGLDVNLIELSKNTNVVDKVLKTPATYGVGDSSLVMEIMKGKHIELLMPIFDESPYVLVALNLPNVKTLKDILKYHIILDKSAYKNPNILSLLASAGDIKKFYFKKINYFDINKKGVFAICTSNELYEIKQLKVPYKIFNQKTMDLIFTEIFYLQVKKS